MNDLLRIFTRDDIRKAVRQRDHEFKIGERVLCADDFSVRELEKSACQFVIIGVPEDIGVRANHGRAGAATGFRPALDSFLNLQSNVFMNGSEFFVLGELLVDDLMEEAKDLDHHIPDHLDLLKQLVTRIDARLKSVIASVIHSGKIPVVIGGGHNNAYGNIMGAVHAFGRSLNVINCDPHLDFRPLEGRHSGNAFSYAYEEKALSRYAVVGMHEQYNNDAAIGMFSKHADSLFFRSFESVFIREELSFKKALDQCISFVKGAPCGIEMDLDAITNVPTSARTSSGISALQARQYVFNCGQQLDVAYFHIAEAAPVLSHIKADNKTGKLIAYLISDFVKGVQSRPAIDGR